MPPKKSKKTVENGAVESTPKSRRRANGKQRNLKGVAQRITMVVDNLTFDKDVSVEHVLRNVTTGIKHLNALVELLNSME